jgi:heterodisulfide reductase subunit C
MTHHTTTLPGVMTHSESELRRIFLKQVEDIPAGERLNRCIQCGTCTGSCPVSYAMDISPRQLIALFRAGEMEKIMKSRTIWICASCYACTTRCPSGIKVTDLIYALKRTAMEKNQISNSPQVQLLAKLFVENLRSYGRLHEGTLIRRYYTRTGIFKLFGFIPLARKMYTAKRLALFPKKIKAHQALSSIISKAQEIEMRQAHGASVLSREGSGHQGLEEMVLESGKGEQS